jgi:hypothetical protein
MRFALGLAMLGLILAIPAASAAQKDYNGRWAIYGTTDKGACFKGFRLSVRIAKGKAFLIGRALNGTKTAVSSRGQVNIKYVKGRDVITASGTLKGGYGAGKWAFPTYRCTGRWRAERL